MTRWLRIALACAIALLVIGTGGLAALVLVPLHPQTTNSMAGALGGPFTLTATMAAPSLSGPTGAKGC